MANICDVTYQIVGDKKEVNTIYKALKYMEKRKTPILKTGWGKYWLGCWVSRLGGDPHEVDCCGRILYFLCGDDGSLEVAHETHWGEQVALRKFLEATFPSVKVYYKEEEPLNEGFYTNDIEGKYFPERYFLDSDADQEYFTTLEEAALRIEQLVGQKVPRDFEEICEFLDDYTFEHQELFFSFHQFQVIDD